MEQFRETREIEAFQNIKFKDNFSWDNINEEKETTRLNNHLKKISELLKTDLAIFQNSVRTSYSQRLPYSEPLSIPYQVPDSLAMELVKDLCSRFPEQVEYRKYEVTASGHIAAYWHPLTNQTISSVPVQNLRGLRIRFL